MTLAEKVTLTKNLINDSEASDSIVETYLTLAEADIRERMYPFGKENFVVPTQYEVLQCKLAARYYLRRGAEGQDSHAENGITRKYGSVNDEDLLSEVMQHI